MILAMLYVDEYKAWWKSRVDRAFKQNSPNVHTLESLLPADEIKSVLLCLNHARICYDRLSILSESIEWIGKFQLKLASWMQLFEAVVAIDRPVIDDVVDALIFQEAELESVLDALGAQNGP